MFAFSNAVIIDKSWETNRFQYIAKYLDATIYSETRKLSTERFPDLDDAKFWEALGKYSGIQDVVATIREKHENVEIISQEILEHGHYDWFRCIVDYDGIVEKQPSRIRFSIWITLVDKKIYHLSYMIPKEAPQPAHDALDTFVANFKVIKNEANK